MVEEIEISEEPKATYGTLPGAKDVTKPQNKYSYAQLITLIILALGNFCAGACVSLQAPFFPAEAEKKGATATEYGLIFGMYQLSIFLTAPFIGKLVAYVSPKFLFNCGILTVGITCIIFGALDYIQNRNVFVALAFVVRIFEGIGAAALRTSLYTITASQFGAKIGTTFATLETFLGVGLIIGPTLGGALYDLGGYGLPFYTVGCVVLLDAFIIFFILPEVERKEMPKQESLLKFWLYPSTLIYSFSVVSVFSILGFVQSALEPHARKFQLSGLYLGLLFALVGVVYAISSPFWGWLCDKMCNSRYLSLVGSLLSILSLFIIGPAPFIDMEQNLYLLVLSLVLYGLSLGGKLVCAFTGTLKDTINRGMPPGVSTYGLVSSMIASSQSFGAFLGPSAGGYFMDEIGFRNSTMVYLLVEVILVLCWMLYFFTKGSRQKSIDISPEKGKVVQTINSTEMFSTEDSTSPENNCNKHM